MEDAVSHPNVPKCVDPGDNGKTVIEKFAENTHDEPGGVSEDADEAMKT